MSIIVIDRGVPKSDCFWCLQCCWPPVQKRKYFFFFQNRFWKYLTLIWPSLTDSLVKMLTISTSVCLAQCLRPKFIEAKIISTYVNWLINKFNEIPITAEVVLLALSILTLFQKNPMASYIPVPTIQTVHSEVIVPTVLTLVQFMDIILDITRRTDCQL